MNQKNNTIDQRGYFNHDYRIDGPCFINLTGFDLYRLTEFNRIAIRSEGEVLIINNDWRVILEL